MRIFVLIVEHHNGHDVYPCASYKRALDRLDQYVLEWWGSTRGRIASEVAPATPGDPATMTQDERINDHSSITGVTSAGSSMRSRIGNCWSDGAGVRSDKIHPDLDDDYLGRPSTDPVPTTHRSTARLGASNRTGPCQPNHRWWCLRSRRGPFAVPGKDEGCRP